MRALLRPVASRRVAVACISVLVTVSGCDRGANVEGEAIVSGGSSSIVDLDMSSSSSSNDLVVSAGEQASPENTIPVVTTPIPADATLIPVEQLRQPFSVVNIFLAGGRTEQEELDQIAVDVAWCMSDAGWDLSPPATVSTSSDDAFSGSLLHYVQVRRRSGYASPLPNLDAGAQAFRQYHLRLDGLTDSERGGYLQSLYGRLADIPDDAVIIRDGGGEYGCYGQARETVLSRRNLTIEQLPFDYGQLLQRILTDSEVVAAEGVWRQCMIDGGYTYESSEGPIREFSVRPPEQPPSEQELAVAFADTTCFATTLHAARRSAEIAALEELIEQFPEWSSTWVPPSVGKAESSPTLDEPTSVQAAAH